MNYKEKITWMIGHIRKTKNTIWLLLGKHQKTSNTVPFLCCLLLKGPVQAFKEKIDLEIEHSIQFKDNQNYVSTRDFYNEILQSYFGNPELHDAFQTEEKKLFREIQVNIGRDEWNVFNRNTTLYTKQQLELPLRYLTKTNERLYNCWKNNQTWFPLVLGLLITNW